MILATLPVEMLPLAIAAVGLVTILRLLSVCTGLAVVGSLLLSHLLGPLVEAVFALLPVGLFVLFLLFVCISIARRMAEIVIGKKAAEHMVGSLAADAVRGLFKLLLLPFRLALAIFSRYGGR